MLLLPLPRAERYTFFTNLKNNNLPRPDQEGKSYDIISWYAGWNGTADRLVTYKHTIAGAATTLLDGRRITYTPYAFPPLYDLASVLRFCIWSVGAVLLSLTDMIRGRWAASFLLAEAASATVVRFAKPDQLAVDYMFDNSDTIYRPAWTYEAEKKGSRIISYYYSTSEEFKLPSGYEANSTYWKLMTWPLYLVWDEYQYQLLRESVGETANIQITGSIWFSSSPDELPGIPAASVAVFDIQPFRDSFHFGFSTMTDLDYNNPQVAVDFIRDIADVLSENGIAFVHKRKRSIGKTIHQGYRRLLDQLMRDNRIISVQPEISPVKVIEKCTAVISMPFTSTAIIAGEAGKSSIYYDPANVIQKDDKGAHGIPVISGKEELQLWVERTFSTRSFVAITETHV